MSPSAAIRYRGHVMNGLNRRLMLFYVPFSLCNLGPRKSFPHT